MKTVVYELLTVAMAMLSIKCNNAFYDVHWSSFKQSIIILIISHVFTLLFGVGLGLLGFDIKKNTVPEAVIRLVSAAVFVLWVTLWLGGIIHNPEFIMKNTESVLRYGEIFAGANIVAAVGIFIRNRKHN